MMSRLRPAVVVSTAVLFFLFAFLAAAEPDQRSSSSVLDSPVVDASTAGDARGRESTEAEAAAAASAPVVRPVAEQLLQDSDDSAAGLSSGGESAEEVLDDSRPYDPTVEAAAASSSQSPGGDGVVQEESSAQEEVEEEDGSSSSARDSYYSASAEDSTEVDDDAAAATSTGSQREGGEEEKDEEEVSTTTDGALDPLAVDVDCSAVDRFPRELFAEQGDDSLVYETPVEMPEGIFKGMGFNRFITVFGVPIVASAEVSDNSLKHAAQIFAGFVDNDEDGLPDRPSSIQSVRDYQTVIGYVNGVEESDSLWKDLYTQDANREFRQQFACNMHFFEQWSSDATPDFHKAFRWREEVDAESRMEEDTCSLLEDLEFDWPLWYFPFTMTYYGYQEDLEDSVLAKIEAAMTRAREEELFFGNYPDDKEMEVADFFVWSLLTKMGALECHCDSDIIEEVWKICTAQGLKEFDEEWYDLIGSMEGIPKKLPSGTYRGAAAAGGGVTRAAVVLEGAAAAAESAAAGAEPEAEEYVETAAAAATDDAAAAAAGVAALEDEEEELAEDVAEDVVRGEAEATGIADENSVIEEEEEETLGLPEALEVDGIEDVLSESSSYASADVLQMVG